MLNNIATATPTTQKIQPTALRGYLDAMSAPTPAYTSAAPRMSGRKPADGRFRPASAPPALRT